MFNSSDTCKKKKKKQLESSFKKSNISQPQMDGWMFSDHQKKKIKNHQTEDLQHYRNTLIKAKIKKSSYVHISAAAASTALLYTCDTCCRLPGCIRRRTRTGLAHRTQKMSSGCMRLSGWCGSCC